MKRRSRPPVLAPWKGGRQPAGCPPQDLGTRGGALWFEDEGLPSSPERLDAFDRWYAGLDGPALRHAEGVNLKSYVGAMEARGNPLDAAGLLRARAFIRSLVRGRLAELWMTREAARALDRWLLEAAQTPTLGANKYQRRLALALQAGEAQALPDLIAAVGVRLHPNYPWHAPVGSPGRDINGITCPVTARLLLMAGSLLRDQGLLEEAHAAFHWSQIAWFWAGSWGGADERIEPRVGGWRWGRWRWDEPGMLQEYIPTVSRVHWARYDHIIGLGTTVRHETLDALGVPRDRQHVVETHRWLPRQPDGHYPRLTGRIAVVDDLSEGATSMTIARLYDADVFDVGHWSCAKVTSRTWPVAEIRSRQALADVRRPPAPGEGPRLAGRTLDELSEYLGIKDDDSEPIE